MMKEPQQPNDPQACIDRLLLRPTQSLQDLPLAQRWEVVRRHPYYQQFWQAAKRHHAGIDDSPVVRQYTNLAAIVMQNLGVADDPPHPGSNGADIGVKDLAKHWRNGAIAPISFSAMAATLIKDLPNETLRMIGELFIESALPIVDLSSKKYDIISRLMQSDAPSLQCYPNRAMVGINLKASQRAIVEAIESYVQEQKKYLEIPEQRRRFDKVPDYLAVWDLREGWTNDHYEIDAELSFGAIAQQRSEPERTIANNYYSAFEMISGHSYNFKNWVQVFMFCKLMDRKGLRPSAGARLITPAANQNAPYPRYRRHCCRQTLNNWLALQTIQRTHSPAWTRFWTSNR